MNWCVWITQEHPLTGITLTLSKNTNKPRSLPYFARKVEHRKKTSVILRQLYFLPVPEMINCISERKYCYFRPRFIASSICEGDEYTGEPVLIFYIQT
ncbi:hypothetical protein EOPP23_16320 [Endozoicomonas sp. OPT23]|nr:hypothetical protein [Endozoicomonas sp. OPT23]